MQNLRGLKRIISIMLAVITVLTLVPFTAMAANVTVPALKNVYAGERYTGVKVYWDIDTSVTGYAVYRSTDRENWTRLKMYTKNTHESYTDKSVSLNTLYFYRVRAYKKVGGKNYYGAYSAIKKVFYGLNEYMTKTGNSLKIQWFPIKYGCDGYELYMSTNGGNYQKIKTLSNTANSSTITGLDTTRNTYAVQLAAYQKNSNGTKNYRYYSSIMGSDSYITNINSTPKTVKQYKRYNYQGSKVENMGNATVSSADINIIKNYESKYLSTQMSTYYKLINTLWYINRTVGYAYDYWRIENYTPVEAIFNHHYGQCLQYNGAMVEYFAYYGFDVALIMGYRGYSTDNCWQHFWGELYMNGRTYVIETGNYENDGTWHYIFTPYANTRGYMKCGQCL